MPFWSTNFGQDTTLKDPKRNFRFIVEFNGINATPRWCRCLVRQVCTAKPSFTVQQRRA